MEEIPYVQAGTHNQVPFIERAITAFPWNSHSNTVVWKRVVDIDCSTREPIPTNTDAENDIKRDETNKTDTNDDAGFRASRGAGAGGPLERLHDIDQPLGQRERRSVERGDFHVGHRPRTLATSGL